MSDMSAGAPSIISAIFGGRSVGRSVSPQEYVNGIIARAASDPAGPLQNAYFSLRSSYGDSTSVNMLRIALLAAWPILENAFVRSRSVAHTASSRAPSTPMPATSGIGSYYDSEREMF